MPTRRVTLVATACLLAGLVTTTILGIVGPLVWDAPPIELTRPFNGDGRTRSALWAVTMVTVDEVLQDREDTREVARTYRLAKDREYFKLEGLPERPPRRTSPQRRWRHYDSGWPFRAFWGWSNEPTAIEEPSKGVGYLEDGDVRRGLVRLPYLVSRKTYLPKHTWVPWHPLWPGLFADSLFYGLIWGAAFVLIVTLRRSMRRRRGQCVKCGYDCTNSAGVCPECGTPSSGRGKM
jgi:hypothetical protein